MVNNKYFLGVILLVVFLAIASFSLAHEGDEAIADGQALVASGVSCANITEKELEDIGEYYMENMHPGEAHEQMDAMMGGEGSEQLRQVHIGIARTLYCHEGNSLAMYKMMGNASNLMQYGGMMSMMGNGYYGSMMGSWTWSWWWSLLYTLLLIGGIIVIVLLIVKLLRELDSNRRDRR